MLIAEILGFRVDRVDQKDEATEELENSFYQFRWEPSWLRGSRTGGAVGFAQTEEITREARESVREIYDEYNVEACLREYSPNCDALCCRAIEHAFFQLG